MKNELNIFKNKSDSESKRYYERSKAERKVLKDARELEEKETIR